MLILTAISYRKYIKYAIYQLIILIFSILPVIFIYERIIEFKVLGFISIGVCLVNLVITMILSFKDVKETIIRKFHI